MEYANRLKLQRFVFFCYLILLFHKWFNSALLSQMMQPVLSYPGLNITYWIPLFFNFHQLFFNSFELSVLLDLLLIASCITAIIWPKFSINVRVFVLLLWLYQFLYTQFLAYQPYAIGLLLPAIPFCFSNRHRFSFAFDFCRYIVCGLYFIGGLLNVVNGAVFEVSHMSNSLKETLVEYLIANSENTTFRISIMEYFIKHVVFAQLLFLLAMLLELSFLLGFFSKKVDWLLISFIVVFHVINSFLLDIPFANHILVVLLFTPSLYKSRLFKLFPTFAKNKKYLGNSRTHHARHR